MAMKVITQSLPRAFVGQAYSARLDVIDGVEPYTWALDGASDPLPAGLSLAATGVISGTPTGVPATYGNLIFEVTDSAPAVATSAALSLTIEPGVYQRAGAYLMEPAVNEAVDRIQGDGDQVNRFELMRHFSRSRDSGSGEPTYLQKLQFFHDSGEVQSPALVNAGQAAGGSVRSALILLDTLIGGGGSLPFTVLPAPTGVAATDTAALNAVWTDPSTLDWLVIPPTGGTAYALNANITSGATRNFKLWASDDQVYHFTGSGAEQVQDLVECRGVRFDGVIPRSQPGAGVGPHLKIFGGLIENIPGIDLFPDDVGEIYQAEIIFNLSAGIGAIASSAQYLRVQDCTLSKIGLGGAYGLTVVTIDSGATSDIIISGNRVSLINDSAAGGIWDLRNGTASSTALIGPNSYLASGITLPAVATGHAGGVAVSPQAMI